ncbi:MAG: hypothetical protein PVH63_13070 [Balneolaceae bacterium]|jgi:TolA-binding protein
MKKRGDTTLLFVLEDELMSAGRQSYYHNFSKEFGQVITIVKDNVDDHWFSVYTDESISYSTKEGKVAAVNRAVTKAERSFLMILENDEYCPFSKLPKNISENSCYRGIIDGAGEGVPQRNYQIRLLPVPDFEKPLFDGFSVPNLDQSFRKSGWKLAEEIIPIHKSRPLFQIADAEMEISQKKSESMSLFWQGILESNNQKYSNAEDKFRKFLKKEPCFEFDYLAALNGLANALVEQHKLSEATRIAKKSLQINSCQRAPYLTLYRVYKLEGRSEEAYQSLNDYLGVLRFASRSNLDVSLSLSECHFLMAETTFKQGDYERAFQHYEWFYELNDRAVSLPVLEKLFIYAIELENYEKSIQFFNDIFGDYIPDKLNDDMSARLLESLSLFMDNGWYDFVCGVYEELVAHNPKDNKLLNGWITSLIKNKEIEKAQKLINNKKAS